MRVPYATLVPTHLLNGRPAPTATHEAKQGHFLLLDLLRPVDRAAVCLMQLAAGLLQKTCHVQLAMPAPAAASACLFCFCAHAGITDSMLMQISS